MKYVLSAGLCVIIAGVILAGCGGNIPTQSEVENEASEVVGTPEDFETLVTIEEVENFQEENPTDLQGKTQRIEIDAEHDFSVLELIGYRIDDEGYVFIDMLRENNCEIELFRKYFFGTWDGWYKKQNSTLIIDDSEVSHLSSGSNLWRFDSLHLRNDTLIITCNTGQVETFVFWININEPNTLYSQLGYEASDNEIQIFNIYNDNEPEFITRTLLKTNTPINIPENEFLSKLRLIEISREYEIEMEMLCEMNFMLDDLYYFGLNYEFYWSPIYLISENPNCLILQSQLIFAYGLVTPIDVIYSINKVNGKWERVIEISEESLEKAREGIINNEYIVKYY